jgi:RNA recognition motif-containing protein
LFNTIGKVERAEIQYEPSGRSRGTGVVQFDSADNAEVAIGRLSMLHFIEQMLTNSQPSSLATFTEAVLLDSPSSGIPLSETTPWTRAPSRSSRTTRCLKLLNATMLHSINTTCFCVLRV